MKYPDLHINEKNHENMAKAMKLKDVDSIPYHFSDQLDFLGGWLNLDCEMYHLNADLTLQAQIEFNKTFSGSGITGPNFGVSIEPSAFGAQVLFSKKTPPWVIHLVKSADEIPELADRMKEPDPITGGLLPLFYQSYFHMQSLTGGKIAPPLGVIAGFDIAALLVGFDNLCLSLMLYPESTHKLLEKINQFLIRFIETKIRLFGVKNIEVIDIYGDYAGYLTREQFTEFVSVYNKKIYAHFNAEVNLYHCDGPLKHLIDLIPEMSCNCLYNFDTHTDIAEFVEKIGNDVCLIGNIDPLRFMRNGSSDEVRKETRRIIEIGKKAKGFVFSTGGEVANGTPPENIHAAIETIEQYGKK